MEVQYVYTKKRAEFGRHANFSDRPAESHVDIAPDPEVRKNFLHRYPLLLILLSKNVKEIRVTLKCRHHTQCRNITLIQK